MYILSTIHLLGWRICFPPKNTLSTQSHFAQDQNTFPRSTVNGFHWDLTIHIHLAISCKAGKASFSLREANIDTGKLTPGTWTKTPVWKGKSTEPSTSTTLAFNRSKIIQGVCSNVVSKYHIFLEGKERLPLLKNHHENHTKDQHVRKSIKKTTIDPTSIPPSPACTAVISVMQQKTTHPSRSKQVEWFHHPGQVLKTVNFLKHRKYDYIYMKYRHNTVAANVLQ